MIATSLTVAAKPLQEARSVLEGQITRKRVEREPGRVEYVRSAEQNAADRPTQEERQVHGTTLAGNEDQLVQAPHFDLEARFLPDFALRRFPRSLVVLLKPCGQRPRAAKGIESAPHEEDRPCSVQDDAAGDRGWILVVDPGARDAAFALAALDNGPHESRAAGRAMGGVPQGQGGLPCSEGLCSID